MGNQFLKGLQRPAIMPEGSSLPDYSEANDGDALIIEDGEPAWGAVDALPEIEETDEGKFLSVDQGEAVWSDAPSGLPEITNADEGKVLTVVDNSGTLEAEWAEPSGGGGLSILEPEFTITVTETLDPQSGDPSYSADKTFSELTALILAKNPNVPLPCLMIVNFAGEGVDPYSQTMFCNALIKESLQSGDKVVITSQPITGWSEDSGVLSCLIWVLTMSQSETGLTSYFADITLS